MKLFIAVVICSFLISCQQQESNMEVDHVNIWLENTQEAKAKLEEIGFTGVPDSLSRIHSGQGTTGRYFYFLNAYLELIYVYDEEEFLDNAKTNPKLDFEERSKSPENGYLPFSIALNMKEYDARKIPFQTVKYAQDWMEEDNAIFAAENSKINKEEPSLFVVYPEITYDKFENLEALSNIPEEYAIWRKFYKHSNGAEKISKIKLHSRNLDQTSSTIQSIAALDNVEILDSDEYLMELYFDNEKQGRSYDLRPEIPLVIHL
ncbi:VOC family protein [Portibacter lacus]|nr:VOC family protein [Portibacter lacus]